MRTWTWMGCVLGLMVASAVAGGAQEVSAGGSAQGSGGAQVMDQTAGDKEAQLSQGVEVLTDAPGVNLKAYLKEVLGQIYAQWTPLVPADARPPKSQQGMTRIRIRINRDGTIAEMRLDGSTYDNALNHAAWASIKSVGHLPPLPREFHGSNLELRIHFLVNQQDE